jgi:NAD(P)-dependent dehydrogenase (short-subunit alcohol dehydrogenase family)
MDWQNPYDLSGKVAAITGGGGILCGTMGRTLGQLGARVALLDIRLEAAQVVAGDIVAGGGEAMGVQVDVMDRASVDAAAQRVLDEYGQVDILINGAGGAKKEATTSEELSFFDLPADALSWVFDLNCLGTVLCSQAFGRPMAEQGTGSIINISSMSAYRPLTRSIAYCAAKAAVSNFTQWLAVHMSQHYSDRIRINAIAPGFFLTDQNRFLLTEQETGAYTERGQAIVAHTPMGRLGNPEDLLGTLLWLLSDGASFVHGAVIPVDGGFSAYSGV